ncbi:ABC transporter A, ABCA, partial [Kipferlia bialata]|eukprot:g8393.t1
MSQSPVCDTDSLSTCVTLAYTPDTPIMTRVMERMAVSIGVSPSAVSSHIQAYPTYEDMTSGINDYTETKEILHYISMAPAGDAALDSCAALFKAHTQIGYNNTDHDLSGTTSTLVMDPDMWDINVYSRLMGALVSECSLEMTGTAAENHQVTIDIDQYKEFPVIAQTFNASDTSFVLSSALLLALMIPVVTVVSDIVSERQSGMAQYFHVMGSMDTAEMTANVILYWVIMSVNYSVMYISSHYLDGLHLFKESDYWALYMVVVPAGMGFVAIGLCLAQLFTKVKTAILVVMFLLIVLLITSVVMVMFAFKYDWDVQQQDSGKVTSEDSAYLGKMMTRFIKFLRYTLPGFHLDIILTGVGWLTTTSVDPDTNATVAAPGFHWSDLGKYLSAATLDPDQGYPDEMTLRMARSIQWLCAQTAGYIVLALYLNIVLRKGYGAPSPPWFFLMPSFWTGTDPKALRNPEIACPELPVTLLSDMKDDFRDPLPLEPVRPLDPTVMTEAARLHKAEKNRLRALDRKAPLSGSTTYVPPALEEEPALLLKGIGKTYGTRPGNHVHAVKALWLSVKQRTCFGLLGSNGSGKSTLIGMLTGSIGTTRGGARVCGYEVQGQMSKIRQSVGIEFQEDRLYPAVTCMQHGMIVALMKGLSIRDGRRRSVELLTSVGLGVPLGDKKKRVQNMRAKELSGGMKRRLSFCLAMLGDPKILFLDEPTSSLDPNSRR